MLSTAQFILGLILMTTGAEALVRGASRLAAAAGVSPLVIGLTVVAFGTSAPELAVSLEAALSGQSGLAVGNLVGSNIFNVLVILGLSALVAPLVVSQQLLRLDVPLMILVSALVLVFGADGRVGRLEGLALVVGLVAYLAFLVRQSRREGREVQDEYAREYGAGPIAGARAWIVNAALSAGGLALLVLGSHWLVESAALFARRLGVSELVIGLTIISAGTSLPEVVTSVVASLKGERDIAVGNAIGSNLFNLMGVLGLTGLLAPDGLDVSPAALRFDLPVMLAVAVACLPVMFTGQTIARWEGAVFLAYYAAYTLYLILAATAHDALPAFSAVMLEFAIPITVLTLAIVTGRAWIGRRRPRAS